MTTHQHHPERHTGIDWYAVAGWLFAVVVSGMLWGVMFGMTFLVMTLIVGGGI